MPPRFRTSVRATILAAGLPAGLLASAAVCAQDYPARDVGGWTVAAGRDGKGCFITQEYQRPGRTTLLLGIDVDGANHLSILNDNWSIKKKDRLTLNFRLSNGGYPDHAAVGIEADGKKGFVTNFEEKFPTFFAASKALHIYRGDVPVEKLSLDGSGEAFAALRRCVDMLRAKPSATAAEPVRADDIPVDPFAADPKRRPKE